MLNRNAISQHPYEVLTYAGNHGYPDLTMKAGVEAAKEKPVDVLIYSARGGHDDLIKVVQRGAISRDPLQVMKIADDLGVDGLGEAAAYSAIKQGFQFEALEYAVQHELHACTETAATGTVERLDRKGQVSLRLKDAADTLSHRTLVAWVSI